MTGSFCKPVGYIFGSPHGIGLQRQDAQSRLKLDPIPTPSSSLSRNLLDNGSGGG